MIGNDLSTGPSILETVDEFIAAVTWDDHRTVTVHRRRHGGRTYVRLRTWNCHLVLGVWYPSPRYFVIPLEHAEELARAILSAARWEPQPKPNWLIEHELEFGEAP